MKKENYIIAITGKTASGKSSIERALEKVYGYKRVISTTTRPMRNGEKQDVDYHFVTDEEFKKLLDNNELIEYRYYDAIENGKTKRWYYGITKDEIDLNKHSVVVSVDLKGLQDLKKHFGNKVISFYIDVPEEKRKLRAIARDINFEEQEFIRRCKDDDIKFKDVKYKVDKIIPNDDFNKCIEQIIFNIDYIKKMLEFYSQYASY